MEPGAGNQEAQDVMVWALGELLRGATLHHEQAYSVMECILRGEATDAQIAALLTALHMRGESVDELVGFARAMRDHARPIFADGRRPAETLVDTCGTGGDGAGTFNVSTAAALVV
ncbi:MAG: hypothetical protein ACRD4D_02525, partial [Candidatus Acidiferrales bacterium]